jgi:pimeloyl-ACP methyl ester carboxylesterase
MIFGALMAKPVAAIGRALVSFEPEAAAARIQPPVLVLQGGKDVQVDPVLDAERLVQARRAAKRDVSYHLSPDADHVLKSEPRPMAEVRSNPALLVPGYNAEGRVLADDLVTALVQWIRARAATRS